MLFCNGSLISLFMKVEDNNYTNSIAWLNPCCEFMPIIDEKCVELLIFDSRSSVHQIFICVFILHISI